MGINTAPSGLRERIIFAVLANSHPNRLLNKLSKTNDKVNYIGTFTIIQCYRKIKAEVRVLRHKHGGGRRPDDRTPEEEASTSSGKPRGRQCCGTQHPVRGECGMAPQGHTLSMPDNRQIRPVFGSTDRLLCSNIYWYHMLLYYIMCISFVDRLV